MPINDSTGADGTITQTIPHAWAVAAAGTDDDMRSRLRACIKLHDVFRDGLLQVCAKHHAHVRAFHANTAVVPIAADGADTCAAMLEKLCRFACGLRTVRCWRIHTVRYRRHNHRVQTNANLML